MTGKFNARSASQAISTRNCFGASCSVQGRIAVLASFVSVSGVSGPMFGLDASKVTKTAWGRWATST